MRYQIRIKTVGRLSNKKEIEIKEFLSAITNIINVDIERYIGS